MPGEQPCPMSMIECVARAIAAELGQQDMGEPFKLSGDLTLPWLDQGEVDFARVARAAIEAMREPTDAMVDEGENHLIGSDAPRFVSGDIWTAMIDAALKSDATGDMR